MFWNHIATILLVLAGSFICWLLIVLFYALVPKEILSTELSEQLGCFITVIFTVITFSCLVYLTYTKNFSNGKIMFWEHILTIFLVLAGSFVCWLLAALFCMWVLEEMLSTELSEQLGCFITVIFIVIAFSCLVYLTYIKPPTTTTKWKKLYCRNLEFNLKKMELEESIPSFYRSLIFPKLECIYSLKFKSRILQSKTFLYVPKNLKIKVNNGNNRKIQTNKSENKD